MIKTILSYWVIIFLFCLLSACSVGPNYVRPCVVVPNHYKEASKHWSHDWKIAQPKDTIDRGKWWEIFHDAKLNALENQLNCCNQNLAVAKANYEQAIALVDEARAAYFPTLSVNASLTRQGQGNNNFSNTSSNNSSNNSSNSNSSTGTSHSLQFNASWEPDIWGSIGRSVEASTAGMQASYALMAATRLSSQGTLAQTYFQLRALDKDQQILDQTVEDYKRALQLTQNQYQAGVAGQTDVVLARTQLETAQALAINNKISRGQLEHAIAVLIGVPPANFSLPPNPTLMKVPYIPGDCPSALLERRPDIANAERLMAQANAQIGVAVAAYFPLLTITGSATYSAPGFAHWFSVPGLAWAIGPQLAETILDGGLRSATIAAAKANYRATIGTYRQTVLAAFQDVEDNLISVRTLKQQAIVENKAARDARLSLELTMNQYKSGTVDYATVIITQITAYNTEKTAADIVGLQMVSAAGLVKALGGGWQVGCEHCRH